MLNKFSLFLLMKTNALFKKITKKHVTESIVHC